MHVKDAVDGYLLFKASHASHNTIETDRAIMDQFLEWVGDVNVSKVTSDDIRSYLAHHTSRGLSPYTIARYYATLSAFWTWLTDPEINLASHNPTDAVDPPKLPKRKPKALDRDDIEALLSATQYMTLGRRARALVLFLLDTGCRASELCGVTMQDIDFDTGKVLVEGKGSKQRYVYLGRRALSAVWLYTRDERPEPAQVDHDNLFLTQDGYPLNRYSLRDAILRLADRVGVHASPHMFRHSAAISHLRHGMDLVSLQHLLGHSQIETTRGYLDALKDEDVQERAKRTSPSDNWRL